MELFLLNCPPRGGFFVSIIKSQVLSLFLPILHSYPSFFLIRFKLEITYKDVGMQRSSKKLSQAMRGTQALWSERSGCESRLCHLPPNQSLCPLVSLSLKWDKIVYFKRDCWEDWWDKIQKALSQGHVHSTSSVRDQESFIAPGFPYFPAMGQVCSFCILL